MIRREAENAGLSDTIVINSCAVTNEAVAQARQAIRRLRREHPIRALSSPAARRRRKPGCLRIWRKSTASSAMTRRCGARPGTTRAPRSIPDLVSRQREDRGLRHHGVHQMAPHLPEGFQSGLPRVSSRCRTAATIAAPSASFPMAAAIRVRCRWAPWSTRSAPGRARPCRVVLTGVDLTSYGADLPGAPKLGQLTKQILRHVPELTRLGFHRSIRSRLTATCST